MNCTFGALKKWDAEDVIPYRVCVNLTDNNGCPYGVDFSFYILTTCYSIPWLLTTGY